MKLWPKNAVELSLLAVMILSALGQFQRFSTPLGMVALHELAMVGFLLLSAWAMRWQYSKLFPKLHENRTAVLLATGFVVWTAITTVANSLAIDSNILLTTGLSHLARLSLYLLFIGVGAWAIHSGQIRGRVIKPLMTAWLLFMAAVGIGQYLFYPDTRVLIELGWDDHLSRAFGTLLDPGFFGLIMAMGATWSLGQWLQNSGSKSGRGWLYPIVFGVMLLALTLSYSRASYLAFVAGILAAAWVVRNRRVLLFIPLLAMAIFLVPKDGGGEGQKLARTHSAQARLEVTEYHSQGLSWQEVLIGRGWYYDAALQLHRQGVEAELGRQLEPVATKHAPAIDNSYLHVLFSTGIVGFVLFIGLIGLTIKKSGKSFVGVWSVLLTHALFSTALFYPWALLFLMGMWVRWDLNPRHPA